MNVYKIKNQNLYVFSNEIINDDSLEFLTTIKESEFNDDYMSSGYWDEKKKKFLIDKEKLERIKKPHIHPETKERLTDDEYTAYLLEKQKENLAEKEIPPEK